MGPLTWLFCGLFTITLTFFIVALLDNKKLNKTNKILRNSSAADKKELTAQKTKYKTLHDDAMRLKELSILQRTDFKKYYENLMSFIDFFIVRSYKKFDLKRQSNASDKAQPLFNNELHEAILTESCVDVLAYISPLQKEMLEMFIEEKKIDDFIIEHINYKLSELLRISNDDIRVKNQASGIGPLDDRTVYGGTDIPEKVYKLIHTGKDKKQK